MKKICKFCGVEKEVCEFTQHKTSADGLNSLCKVCFNKRARDKYKNRSVKQQASKVFSYINKRCNNENLHKERPKYELISNLLNKQEFIEWYEKNYFKGCEVDRIKDNDDYKMSNIQLLSKEEHNHKRKLERDGFVEDGFKKCNKCKEIKPATKEFFSVHKRQISSFNKQGLIGICKECVKETRRKHNKKGKEDV